MAALDEFIAEAPDPAAAALRYDRLREIAEARRQMDDLPPSALRMLVAVLGISNFLFHLLCRHPEFIPVARHPGNPSPEDPACMDDFPALRLYKYREMLRITCLDLANGEDYQPVLTALSELADGIIRRAFDLVVRSSKVSPAPLCLFGLGKLGAEELNYSSDVDLIFVSAGAGEIVAEAEAYQKSVSHCIRRLTRLLEEQTDEGFLYRVDLKLRPWGRSGPLAMPVEAMEHYYEASTEAWERFAWLRARVIAGAGHLGADLLQRLQPFIFLRSLSVADLDRFLEIKGQMARRRHRRGAWNVKVGEGGIRDIEFFVQMLQLVNGANYPALRTTNTLRAIAALSSVGLLDAVEAAQLRQSYLFLRRLENHLQMFDEQQTHDLPDGRREREVIARSFGYGEGALERFEEALSVHRAVARGCFDRILPKEVEI